MRRRSQHLHPRSGSSTFAAYRRRKPKNNASDEDSARMTLRSRRSNSASTTVVSPSSSSGRGDTDVDGRNKRRVRSYFSRSLTTRSTRAIEVSSDEENYDTERRSSRPRSRRSNRMNVHHHHSLLLEIPELDILTTNSRSRRAPALVMDASGSDTSSEYACASSSECSTSSNAPEEQESLHSYPTRQNRLAPQSLTFENKPNLRSTRSNSNDEAKLARRSTRPRVETCFFGRTPESSQNPAQNAHKQSSSSSSKRPVAPKKNCTHSTEIRRSLRHKRKRMFDESETEREGEPVAQKPRRIATRGRPTFLKPDPKTPKTETRKRPVVHKRDAKTRKTIRKADACTPRRTEAKKSRTSERTKAVVTLREDRSVSAEGCCALQYTPLLLDYAKQGYKEQVDFGTTRNTAMAAISKTLAHSRSPRLDAEIVADKREHKRSLRAHSSYEDQEKLNALEDLDALSPSEVTAAGDLDMDDIAALASHPVVWVPGTVRRTRRQAAIPDRDEQIVPLVRNIDRIRPATGPEALLELQHSMTFVRDFNEHQRSVGRPVRAASRQRRVSAKEI